MAYVRFTISTDATGELSKDFVTTEENMQRHFRRMLAAAAPITDTRLIDDPNNLGQQIEETYQRPRKLGECLTDLLNEIIRKVESETLSWEQSQALAEAQAKIKPIGFDPV